MFSAIFNFRVVSLLSLLFAAQVALALSVWTYDLPSVEQMESWSDSTEAERSLELDSLIAQHRQAMLGVGSERDINALTLKGRFLMGGAEYPFTVRKMRPNYFRLDVQAPSGAMVQAFDGKRGWLLPAGGDMKTDAQWMDRQGNAAMERDAVMLNYLIEAENQQVEIRLLGKRSSTSDIGVEVELANGGLVQYWIDPNTFLINREVKPDYIDGGFKFRTAELSDYRDVGGLLVAHDVKHLVSGAPESELVFDEIKVVDEHPLAIFQAPLVDDQGTGTAAP